MTIFPALFWASIVSAILGLANFPTLLSPKSWSWELTPLTFEGIKLLIAVTSFFFFTRSYIQPYKPDFSLPHLFLAVTHPATLTEFLDFFLSSILVSGKASMSIWKQLSPGLFVCIFCFLLFLWDSHIAKHWKQEHEGEEMPEFRFRIVRSFRV